jgi:hypothetical protein
MPRTPRWIDGREDRGVVEIRFSHWKWFPEYIHQEMLDFTSYIYRGHADSTQKLEPSLDRIIKSPHSARRKKHLDRFKLAVRGRRGSNPPTIVDENGWWALGQHHGLCTPLLDWTESPFVALYFAMVKAKEEPGASCCVWALSEVTIEKNSRAILNDESIKAVSDRKPIVEIFRPMSDENSRLVNQRGLFTRGPNNMDLQQWIQTYDDDSGKWGLIKMVIPKVGTDICLRYLNRMNINPSTLYPDLYGASQFCNMALRTGSY